jgi:FG-GAP repeat
MKTNSAFHNSAQGRVVSPAPTDVPPDETIAAQDSVAAARPRRTAGQRFGPLYWLAAFVVVAGSVVVASRAPAQPALEQFSQPFTQEGSKLVGTFAVGLGEQGWSVALSADSNTAMVGGLADNKITGAAWVYIRRNGVWTQQSGKLVGTGAVGSAAQGFAVALSDDGNTAIVGGPFDNQNAGAAWVYTRSDGVWTQQGDKLVGIGAVGAARQGVSVALSADGNTVMMGGTADNADTGATWVFIRRDGVWTQQAKLVGSGAVGNAAQGVSVALSDDGNTAIVGGLADNRMTGAAWVYTRSSGVWTQQGKLVGTGAVGAAAQGASVALCGDGNTALVGGLGDNQNVGAAWVYTRSSGVWTQQGNKLVGTGAVGTAGQGVSVALSHDGGSALVGGVEDNGFVGAAWVFSRNGSAWTQQGNKLVGTDAVGSARQGHSVALSAAAISIRVRWAAARGNG